MKIFGLRLIDLINPVRWYKFLSWKEVEREGILEIPMDEVQERSELLVYRSLSCPECLENGTCLVCGCHTAAKMIDPSESCPEGKWQATTVDAWKKSKDGLGIKFKIDRG